MMKTQALNYEKLVKKLRKQAAAALRRTCGSAQGADDRVQETVARFLARGGTDSVDPRKGTADTLCGGILRLVGFEDGRKRARGRVIVSNPNESDQRPPLPLSAMVAEETWGIILEGMSLLTEKEIMGLRRRYGWSGRPSAADRSAADRAVEKLREYARLRGLMDD